MYVRKQVTILSAVTVNKQFIKHKYSCGTQPVENSVVVFVRCQQLYAASENVLPVFTWQPLAAVTVPI